MFNSTILDVAIGMIFIYLLLSLMCTAASEIIELMLKKRAIDLERGIRELLVPGSNSGNPDIVRDFYNHPLINGLFGGRYENSRIATRVRWVARTALPSYIPARNFSLALMDLILPGVTPGAAGGPSGATGATVPSPSPASPAAVVVNVAAGAAPAAVPPTALAVPPAAPTAVPPAAPAVVPPPTPAPTASLKALRDALLDNPDIAEQIKRGLVPLIDAAGNDMARVRENIEGWYNASMDRVSSWYKRRAQVTILILGLFIAITVNVDTLTIAKRLSTDKALRESLVAASDAYAKANATAPDAAAEPPTETTAKPAESTASPGAKPAGEPPGSTPSTPAAGTIPSPSAAPTVSPSGVDATGSSTSTLPAPCVRDADSAACNRANDLQKACEDKTSTECQRAKDLQEACKDQEDSPKCKYLANLQQIQSLGLPIGWDSATDPRRTWPGWHWKRDGGWWDQIYWHGLGWLLTALALSLGAPFWFDLLNKFIVIRSAVKPHEKSPEEGSKD